MKVKEVVLGAKKGERGKSSFGPGNGQAGDRRKLLLLSLRAKGLFSC